ncbi:MAG: PD-(D/E)XK nuclease family protein [Elusimicrobiota bacterium]
MTYQRTKYPPWSWSSSRNNTFQECKRKYYYNYYLAHNGWEDSAPEECKLAYRLKKLTGIYLILGSAVHEVAEYACKIVDSTGEYPDKKKLIDKVRYLLNQAWKESREPHKWKASPNQYFMLQEFYYGNGLSDNLIKKIKNRLYKAVDNLYESPSINDLVKQSCSLEMVENMDTFNFKGTPVYAIPDLVYTDEAGDWYVVDWKTGKEYDKHDDQLNLYALYIKNKFGISADLMKGRVEYLLNGSTREVKITEKSLEEAKEKVSRSIEDMKKYLKDPDKNIPCAKEKFPLTDQKRFCKWCKFYELDKEELGDIL